MPNYKEIFDNLSLIEQQGENSGVYFCRLDKRIYFVKMLPKKCFEYYSLLQNVKSPFVATPLYIASCNDNCIAVMREYLSGCVLSKYLEENGGTLHEKEVVKIACNVCLGLHEMHKMGVIHRDVNPNNIIITSDGAARIIDFDISRKFVPSGNRDTIIMGTPGYAAPEQFGFAQSDARTDIYAIGVLINVMMTGELPGTLHAKGELGEIVTICTSIDATRRYSDVMQVWQSLCSILSGSNQKPASPSSKSQIKFFLRKRWYLIPAFWIISSFALSFVGYYIIGKTTGDFDLFSDKSSVTSVEKNYSSTADAISSYPANDDGIIVPIDGKTTFFEGKGKLGDCEVEILSCRSITNSQGQKVVIIKYKYTNYSSEACFFSLNCADIVFQSGISLDTDYYSDYDSGNATKEIKNGASIEAEKAYTLIDDSAEIEVEVENIYLSGEAKVVKTFNIK